MASRGTDISEAVENYAKAIYAIQQRRRHGDDQRDRRAPRRHGRIRVGDGQEARQPRPGQPRAVQGRRAHRRRRARGARGHPPSPAARALPRRVARRAVGPRPCRGRGARARPLRGARGAHRGQARQSHRRSARRSDPDGGPRDRGASHQCAGRSRRRGARHLRAHLGLRPGDAALPGRARHRARRRLRGHRQAAVRRADLRRASATTSTCWAARWRVRCGPRWHERARGPPAGA